MTLRDTPCLFVISFLAISWTGPTSATDVPSTATAAPTYSPKAGTYTTAQKVSISDATTAATIYYTTNGTTPTTASTKYTVPIAVSRSETVKAIAVATGFTESAVASALYTIETPAATPVLSPKAGTYTTAQKVSISDATTAATIYYTTNGTTPTTASTKYTVPIAVSRIETVKAIAVASGFTESAVASALYTIETLVVTANPIFSPKGGAYTTVQKVSISDATAGATIFYTTNGTMPTTSSTKYTAPITVNNSETIEALAIAPGDTQSGVASAAYNINLKWTESIIFSFDGSDGAYPQAGLTIDAAGNLYGTSEYGGATYIGSPFGLGTGTVFKISVAGAESVLHSFTGSGAAEPDGDGYDPTGSLIIDSGGNLYGTTPLGGANNTGTVFKISASGAYSVLYSFAPNSGGVPDFDGANPSAGLIVDGAGNLYGTTSGGGPYSFFQGTVFKISAAGAETVLHFFGDGNPLDGDAPVAGLIRDTAGNLYGTTSGGGTYTFGTVFKIAASGTESVLYSLGFGPDGGQGPVGGVVMDSDGNLYGTTVNGGANSTGTVFKISAAGDYSLLYSFGASAKDGQKPHGGLIRDSAGNLYGTTAMGGTNGAGTVFEIEASGTESILYSFGSSATDGQIPYAGLTMDSAGNLYGTTFNGGSYNYGAVFKLSP